MTCWLLLQPARYAATPWEGTCRSPRLRRSCPPSAGVPSGPAPCGPRALPPRGDLLGDQTGEMKVPGLFGLQNSQPFRLTQNRAIRTAVRTCEPSCLALLYLHGASVVARRGEVIAPCSIRAERSHKKTRPFPAGSVQHPVGRGDAPGEARTGCRGGLTSSAAGRRTTARRRP